ncbi:fungal-specific transcription factor domain-containing protein [Aspergillus karnatakaensis]|uniref:Zn(II)2Cys6 transcription factor n=1 Tax=Aspergillus karnatakaensis TaxID=1810916 RepID=UPI003CCCAE7D
MQRRSIRCAACRHSKIKCSGDEPCLNCRRRSLDCQFTEGNSKILVDEQYLHDLQRQAYNWQRATGVKRPRDDCFRFDDDIVAGKHPPTPRRIPGTPANELSCSIWTSPFTLPTTVLKDTHQEQRKWIWLAPSSPWSLTRRLIVMMTDKFDQSSVHDLPPPYLDGDIYPLSWNSITLLGKSPIDTSNLPSLDYALYLFNIVRFRLGQGYRFFETDLFITRMNRFYATRPDESATEPRFWLVQFLMVLALGNAFLARPRNQRDPPGSKYFNRAMAAMPPFTSTGKDSLLAIEALALVSLYLYAIDHREAAHVHIGQAIRIAQLEGLHTQLPEEVLGAATVARCRNLWWSLYILDRHISPSLGLPLTTRDSDITTLINPPDASHQQDRAFSLQVRITRMLSFIISTIYETEKTQLGTFLEITRSILETMAKYAEEIERMLNPSSSGHGHGRAETSIPEESRHTILLYHQCVIVATRPLLLSVLKERLEKLGRAEEDWQKFLALPKSLIATGIKSAEKTLQILGDENGLLETFLPFDLQLTYASALHLTMAHALFPSPDNTTRAIYSQKAHSILSELILCGNRVAEARQRELTRIEGLFQQFSRQVEQRGLRHLTLSETANPIYTVPNNPNYNGNINNNSNISNIAPLPQGLDGGSPAVAGSQMQSDADNGHGHGLLPEPPASSTTSSGPENINQSISADSPPAGNVVGFDSFGISSYEFLSIVDQITNPALAYGELDIRPEWLAGGGEDGEGGEYT